MTTSEISVEDLPFRAVVAPEALVETVLVSLILLTATISFTRAKTPRLFQLLIVPAAYPLPILISLVEAEVGRPVQQRQPQITDLPMGAAVEQRRLLAEVEAEAAVEAIPK